MNLKTESYTLSNLLFSLYVPFPVSTKTFIQMDSVMRFTKVNELYEYRIAGMFRRVKVSFFSF